MTLYEITDDYMRLLEMMGEDDVDPDAIRDTFEALDGTFEDKADNYAKVMKNLDGEVEALDVEIKRLKDRKDSIERTKDRIKSSLMVAMVATGKTKFKTPLFSFGIQKNPPSVEISDGAKIPEKYLIPQEPKIDKKSIMEELKMGNSLSWAKLTQTERLSIR